MNFLYALYTYSQYMWNSKSHFIFEMIFDNYFQYFVYTLNLFFSFKSEF